MTLIQPESYIKPCWPAPSRVHALSTTRLGGTSSSPYSSMNLALHVGDSEPCVLRNRELLNHLLPAKPNWLNQVHGTQIVNITQTVTQHPPQADAAISCQRRIVLSVLTADCLPLLLCDRSGSVVAAVHAGWRGLLNGIIESTVMAMPCSPTEIYAWLGPAIGPYAFEVSQDVFSAFTSQDRAALAAFTPAKTPKKWQCDLYQLAQHRLNKVGVSAISGGDHCTYTEKELFFSYRRDQVCGRMASLIWLD